MNEDHTELVMSLRRTALAARVWPIGPNLQDHLADDALRAADVIAQLDSEIALLRNTLRLASNALTRAVEILYDVTVQRDKLIEVIERPSVN